jgi:hypothetical protein
MVLVTKKPSRSLADCVEWQQALSAEQELKAQFEAATAAIMAFEKDPNGRGEFHDSAIGTLAQTILSEVTGNPPPAKSSAPKHSDLRQRQAAVGEALARHRDMMSSLCGRLGQEIYATWATEHHECLAEIAHTILELKSSFDAEAALAEKMNAAGCFPRSVASRPWPDISQFRGLRKTLLFFDAERFRQQNADFLEA